MENNNREIIIDDAKLYDLVEQKGAIVEQGRELSKEMEEIAIRHGKLLDEQNKLIKKANKIKIDIVRKTHKLVGDQLSEYEVPVTTDIKDGKVVFTCADTLAEYKESFAKIDKWQEARTPTKKLK